MNVIKIFYRKTGEKITLTINSKDSFELIYFLEKGYEIESLKHIQD